jgi:hypothetical protein
VTAPPRRNTAHTLQVSWSGDSPHSGSPGLASRRVAEVEGVIRKARKGREVLISLH